MSNGEDERPPLSMRARAFMAVWLAACAAFLVLIFTQPDREAKPLFTEPTASAASTTFNPNVVRRIVFENCAGLDSERDIQRQALRDKKIDQDLYEQYMELIRVTQDQLEC